MTDGATGDDAALRELKAALRARVRAARRARPEAARTAAGRAFADAVAQVPGLAGAGCVTAYVSTPGEPDTEALREVLRSGHRLLLPVVLPHGLLEWADDVGRLRTDPAGVPRLGGAAPDSPLLGLDGIGLADLVLAPGLAVDTTGRRLGQGGGYYDRALARLEKLAPRTPVVAVLYDEEVLDAGTDPVPAGPHDRRVQGVLTPSGYRPLAT